MFDETPAWTKWILLILAFVWCGSLSIVLAPAFGYSPPVGSAAAATFSSATASIILVIVTTWQLTSHRELVEETKEARIQEVAPLIVPDFPRGLGPQKKIHIQNIGNGPAFDVTGCFILKPTDEQVILWESAPILPPDHELRSHQPIHGGDEEDMFEREQFFEEYDSLQVRVEYTDTVGQERETVRDFDFDFQWKMHNPQSIED